MKGQNGLKFPSELYFSMINVTKDSYLVNSKVSILKSDQNAAGICPFFYGAPLQDNLELRPYKNDSIQSK